MTDEANANSALRRKQAALAEQRAEALRANLKRRKNQSSARDVSDVRNGDGSDNSIETRKRDEPSYSEA